MKQVTRLFLLTGLAIVLAGCTSLQSGSEPCADCCPPETAAETATAPQTAR